MKAAGEFGVKLLYIEDNADAAADLTALLARHGSQVIWEMRGADGLRRAAAEPFDTIILDQKTVHVDRTMRVRAMQVTWESSPAN